MIDGGKCRRCNYIGLERRKTKKHKVNSKYGFQEYLLCPSCKIMYMDNNTKFLKNCSPKLPLI